MNLSYSFRPTLLAAAASLLAACGGSETQGPTGQQFVAQTAPGAPSSDRLRALGAGAGSTEAAAVAITNSQLFQWAQLQYPELFGTAAPLVIANLPYDGKVFDVRDFGNGAYLGIADGIAYGLGPFTNGALVSFGPIQNYADMVCSLVQCDGAGGGGSGGALNDCAGPALDTLAIGFKTRSVFVYSGSLTGEQTVETEKKGTTTFEGQTVTESLAKSVGSNTVEGFTVPVTTTSKIYSQSGTNGLTKTIGSLVDAVTGGLTIGGFTLPDTTMSYKVVSNPPVENAEFTLSEGQSLTKTQTTRTTVISSSTGVPAPGTVTDATETTTWTFVRRESVSVPAGTFNACRYSTSTEGKTTTSWFIIGKGLLAMSEAVVPGQGTQIIELKSGTFGGSPL